MTLNPNNCYNWATEANYISMLTLINPGEIIATPAPYYAAYKPQVEVAGGVFLPIDVKEMN